MIALPGRRAVTAAAVTAATLLLTAGCNIPAAIPSRPAWWPKPTPSAQSGAGAASGQGGEAAPSPSASAVPQVTDVWQQGMPQLGVDVYWQANPSDNDSVIAAKARRIVNYAISLGANSISLSFPFYTYGLTSNVVYASPQTTPSPEHIAIFLSAAAASHIRVTLRPVLNEDILVQQDPNAWRGSIDPAAVSAWFSSYQQLLIPYAQVAASGGAATFVVGTELESLQGDPQWAALISAVQAVYPGQVIYDQNYLDFTDHITDQPLAAANIDAYPRFSLPDSAPVSELASDWENFLSHGPHSVVLSQMVLSEVGIDAVSGSYDDPGTWVGMSGAPIEQSIQVNWFQAVCQAVQADHLAGVYWWDVNFDADPANPAQADSGDPITFIGRAGQSEIKACFTQIAGTSG
jgi:hypothetical protein